MSFTLHDAERALIRVGSAARRGDIDGAQREERILYLKTLQAIASGAKDARELAATAAKAAQLEYDR